MSARPAGTRAAARSAAACWALTARRLFAARSCASAASALPRRLTVRADLQGRYTFPDLPTGRYTVSASKAGYLALEYGQRRPFEAGRRIELGAAERLTGVDILLPLSASIAGVVIDDAGERVNQMWVMAARQAYRNGRRARLSRRIPSRTTSASSGCSGLAPGDYYIVTRERDATGPRLLRRAVRIRHHALSRGLDAGSGPTHTRDARTAGDRRQLAGCRRQNRGGLRRRRRRDRAADDGAALQHDRRAGHCGSWRSSGRRLDGRVGQLPGCRRTSRNLLVIRERPAEIR